MDSIEVAVRFTEAIMAKPGAAPKGADPAETYVDMFAEVLKRVSVVMNPPPGMPPLRPPRPTSDIFPLSHEGRE